MDPPVMCCNCGQRLDSQPGSGDPGTTCPRCGAAPVSETAVQAGAPNELSSLACPHCGKSIPPLCLFCPHCEQALEDFGRRLRANAPSPTERNRSGSLEGVLAGFGFPILLACPPWILLALADRKTRTVGLQFLVGYLFLLGLTLVFAEVSLNSKGSSARPSWNCLLLRMMAFLGALVLLAMACLLVFFVVCSVAYRF